MPAGEAGGPFGGYENAAAPARENVSTASQAGNGLKALGRGVSDVASSGLNYALEQQKKTDDLDIARANSAWAIQKANLDAARAEDTDEKALREQYHPKYQNALEGAASLIRDGETRSKFLINNQPHVEQGRLQAVKRADGLQQDAFVASTNESLTALRDAGLKAKDEGDKAFIIQSAGTLIDQMAENGYISQTEAVRMKKTWTTNFAEAATASLPPAQRLQALRPVNTGEQTKQAFDFFVSKGWSKEQAAGIVGNLLHESGGSSLNTSAVAAGDGADGSDSIGIAQWNAERAQALKAYAKSKGKDWTDLQTQLEFVQKELETTHSEAAQKIKGATDVRSAAEAMLAFEKPKNWNLGLSGAHGGANRLHQATGVYSAMQGSSSAKPSQLAELIPEDRRKAMTDATEAEITNGLREQAAQQRQETATVKSLMADDNASILATGKPLDALDPMRVGKAMGPDAEREFVLNRTRAINYYNATKDFDTLPSNQMEARIESLKPRAGASGYAGMQQYYEQAQQKAQEIIKARANDPAGAVANLPAVKQAQQGVDYQNPESLIPLVKARLAAQDAIGIPASQQQPMTKSEAQRIMAPVVNALPGTERQQLQQIIPYFQKAFGGQADRALQFAIEQAKVDTDTAGIAASMFKKIGMGQKPTQTDQNMLATAQTNGAMAKAAGATPDASTPRTAVRPPSEAIKALIQNPSRAAEFDQLFGQGMAKRVLGEYGTMTKGATPNG